MAVQLGRERRQPAPLDGTPQRTGAIPRVPASLREMSLDVARQVAGETYIGMHTAHVRGGVSTGSEDFIDEAFILNSLRKGADDFIEKEDTTELLLFLHRVLSQKRMREERDDLRQRLHAQYSNLRLIRHAETIVGQEQLLVDLGKVLQPLYEYKDSQT